MQDNGSLLLASNAEEASALQCRAVALATEGIDALLLSPTELRRAEPNIAIPAYGVALYVAEDAQLVTFCVLIACCLVALRFAVLRSPLQPAARQWANLLVEAV